MSTLPTLEILGPIRVFILTNTNLVAQLGDDKGSPAVLTERPVPDYVTYPITVVGPIIVRNGIDDGINFHRPRVEVDLSVYGKNPSQSRAVDSIAEMLFSMFHQQPPMRKTIEVENYETIQILASGPSPAPTDDEKGKARRVGLTVSLRALYI